MKVHWLHQTMVQALPVLVACILATLAVAQTANGAASSASAANGTPRFRIATA